MGWHSLCMYELLLYLYQWHFNLPEFIYPSVCCPRVAPAGYCSFSSDVAFGENIPETVLKV